MKSCTSDSPRREKYNCCRLIHWGRIQTSTGSTEKSCKSCSWEWHTTNIDLSWDSSLPNKHRNFLKKNKVHILRDWHYTADKCWKMSSDSTHFGRKDKCLKDCRRDTHSSQRDKVNKHFLRGSIRSHNQYMLRVKNSDCIPEELMHTQCRLKKQWAKTEGNISHK